MSDTCGSFEVDWDDAEANVVGAGAEDGEVWIAGISGISLNMSCRKSNWLSTLSGVRGSSPAINLWNSLRRCHPVPMPNHPLLHSQSPADLPAIPAHQETLPPPCTRYSRRQRFHRSCPHSALRRAATAIDRSRSLHWAPRCPSSSSDRLASTRGTRMLVAPRRSGGTPGSSRRI
jgi:hypothetical protein